MDNRFLEPFLNLKYKYLTYFFVGYDKHVGVAFAIRKLYLPDFGKVACSKKHTPYIVNAVLNLIICQVLTNHFFNCLACNQALNLILCR